MLHHALLHSLDQVMVIFQALDAYPASQANALYTHSGTGRHIRHIHDHFLALQQGLPQARVDYNLRHRDSPIETERAVGRIQIQTLMHWCETFCATDKPLTIISEIDCLQTLQQQFQSSLQRELLYLINHTIHHVAHIKLLLAREGVDLPESIGLAPATATFLRNTSDQTDTA